MLVLESATVKALLGNNELIANFPFLAIKPQPVSGCCGNSKTGGGLNAVKSAIASLSGPQRQRFKELVKASKIKVSYHIAGRIVTTTF